MPGTPTESTTQEDVEPFDAVQAKVGDVVGSYRLLRLLGEGASGRVFEVEHVQIGRRAAMKILSPEHALRHNAVQRLLSEARAVNRINHPHIVEITDVLESDVPGGASAVVMELLEGQSLAQVLVKEGRLPPERYVPILAQVADALAAAHAAGFVHRDLKPENIFLTVRERRRDYVKLLDFGIAKSLIPESASPPGVSRGPRAHVTVEGTFLGTPAYASPEQASGKPVDHRTDIYSLGVILYELNCGRLPFEGRNLGEFLVKHITLEPPAAPPEVVATPLGQALDQVARRCLEKDPASRYRSAGQIKDVLDQIFEGDVLTVAMRLPQRRAWTVPTGVAAVALMLGGLLLAVSGWPKTRRAIAPSATESSSPAGPAIVPLAPPAAAKVALSFESDPPEAEVRRVGHSEMLGLTPFVQIFPAEVGTAVFEMRRPGYAPARFEVALTRDATVGGPLRKLVPRQVRSRAPAGPSAPANRESTLNPFGP
jgi:eukaryotic-like serine/threonine-protein kinase